MFLKTKKNILFVRDYLLKVINNGPLVFQNLRGGGGGIEVEHWCLMG